MSYRRISKHIRLPDVTIPLATYTGWNSRHAQIGSHPAVDEPDRLKHPVPSHLRVNAQRKADPRRSIAVRYPGKAAYLDEVSHAAQCPIDAGYLLPEGLERTSAKSACCSGIVVLRLGFAAAQNKESDRSIPRVVRQRRSDEGDVINGWKRHL